MREKMKFDKKLIDVLSSSNNDMSDILEVLKYSGRKYNK